MKSQKGQSLVEFALVLPILALLLFGIADFGRAFHIYITLDHIGREVAREVMIHPDDETKKMDVLTSQSAALNFDALVYEVEKETFEYTLAPDEDPEEWNAVRVFLKYPMKFITPFLGEIEIKNTTIMRLQ